jgi:hypothetical protein
MRNHWNIVDSDIKHHNPNTNPTYLYQWEIWTNDILQCCQIFMEHSCGYYTMVIGYASWTKSAGHIVLPQSVSPSIHI